MNSQKLEMTAKKQNFLINNFLFNEKDIVVPVEDEYEKINLMEYKTKLKEINFKRSNRYFLEKEKTYNFSFKIARILRDKLLLLPHKLTPIVSEINDEKEVYRILKEELENVTREIRRELARKI